MKIVSYSISTVTVIALLSTGCIHTSSTSYRDADRVGVQFENDEAGRVFYNSLNGRTSRPREESSTEISIPIVFSHKNRVVQGDNTVFNRSVSRCDTNADGIITLTEAEVFAQSRRARH